MYEVWYRIYATGKSITTCKASNHVLKETIFGILTKELESYVSKGSAAKLAKQTEPNMPIPPCTCRKGAAHSSAACNVTAENRRSHAQMYRFWMFSIFLFVANKGPYFSFPGPVPSWPSLIVLVTHIFFTIMVGDFVHVSCNHDRSYYSLDLRKWGNL